MRHLSDGVLRRLVDEAAAVADADREHVATCARCRTALATIRDDADLVAAALAPTAPDAHLDLDGAWRRLTAGARAAPSTRHPRVAAAAGGGRLRRTLRRPAVAGVVVAAALAGAGTAAANGWLEIFRTEQVAPVRLGPDDLNALPDLRAYGDVAVTGDPDVHGVPDAATAAAETGLEVPAVRHLPRGVTGEPTYHVGGQVSATFTFSAERAARAAAQAGGDLPPPPPGLDGSELRLVAGPGVAQVWSKQAGVPALVVGRAAAPTAYSSGVPFDTARDYLLSIPGVPEHVADALRTFNADRATLPLPIPAGRVTTAETEVDGRPATLLTTRDRTLAAVVWVDDGLLTVVAGALDADEVLSVAEGLR